MAIIKPNKHSAQGQPMQTSSNSTSRKSSRVSRPSSKLSESLTSHPTLRPSRPSLNARDSSASLSSSPLRPPPKATGSFASLSSSSSRPPLQAADSVASLTSSTFPQSPPRHGYQSRASSPDSEPRTHISVTDSEVEVDPQAELGTHVAMLHHCFLTRFPIRQPQKDLAVTCLQFFQGRHIYPVC